MEHGLEELRLGMQRNDCVSRVASVYGWVFRPQGRVQDFRKLKVWQKSHRLAIDLELSIRSGPRWTFPGLRRQTLRAAGSVPDTIAEGCGKQSPRELARYADMASGSASELLGQLLRARDLGYLSSRLYQHFERRIEEIRKMLWSLAVAVRRKYPR